jgi:hypothetical protein
VLNGQHPGRVVNGAVSVVVVADGAVKLVILEDTIECLALGGDRRSGVGRDSHPVYKRGGARAHQLSIDFNDARVTRLDRAELRVVTNLRQLGPGAINHINQPLAGFYLSHRAVQHDRAQVDLSINGRRGCAVFSALP